MRSRPPHSFCKDWRRLSSGSLTFTRDRSCRLTIVATNTKRHRRPQKPLGVKSALGFFEVLAHESLDTRFALTRGIGHPIPRVFARTDVRLSAIDTETASIGLVVRNAKGFESL